MTLCLLLLIVILKYIPLWIQLILPYNDALYAYQGFYAYYNEYFINNELLQWIPYGSYGVHASFLFQLSATPSRLFVGLIGLLFRVSDTMLLFNLAYFIDECILLAGLYLLSKKYFTHKFSIFFVCSTVILSSTNLGSPYLTFQIYYALPLILYFIHQFFDKAKLYFLLIGLNIFVLSFVGTAGYSVAVQSLPINIFFTGMFISRFKHWKRYIAYTKADLQISAILFIGALAFTCSLLAVVLDFRQAIELLFSGRDSGSLATSLNVFLTYGKFPGWNDLFDLIVPSLFTTDYTLYTGIGTLFFLLFSFFSKKPSTYYTLLVTICILVLFSLGPHTPIAEFLFRYYPAMKYYRHVGYVICFWVIFAPLLAGFGLDNFLKKYFNSNSRTSTIITFLLLAAILFNLVNYRKLINNHIHKSIVAAGPFNKHIFTTHKYNYQPYRTNDPPNKRAQDAKFLGRFLRSFPKSTDYSLFYSFADWDPCIPSRQFSVDYINKYVAELIRMRGGAVRNHAVSPPNNPSMLSSLGCQDAKIKVLKSLRKQDAYPGLYDLTVERFSANQIDILADLGGSLPAWLYYADAWHPAWHLTVNGKKISVARANHAFKAAPLMPGTNYVSFVYDNGKVRAAEYFIMFYGILWILIFVLLAIKQFTLLWLDNSPKRI